MRLLRVADQQFVEVPSHGPFPPYGILSHTWIQPSIEEVTYQDLVNQIREDVTAKAGWHKIRNAIDQAGKDGFPYVWIDTCCINKLDPTELTEAINCMYNWYAESACCYAYLSDVDIMQSQAGHVSDQLRKSQWFTRGWTLQELVAPMQFKIYDRNWLFVATRDQFATGISATTMVPDDLLKAPATIAQYSIANRMSWAAGRRTTRAEDRAYSLLGIFGIMMPLHYGEGEEHAFKRLQQEIIRQDADQSILAWQWPASFVSSAPWDMHQRQAPFLAPSPDCFRTRSHVTSGRRRQSVAYSISNLGLEIEAYLMVYKKSPSVNTNPKSMLTASLSRSKPVSSLRARPLQEHVGDFVGAIIDCSSRSDSSMVYMLPVDKVVDGVYMLARPMECLEMEWSDVQMQMELLNSESAWQKITILRTPQSYGVDVPDTFGHLNLCAKFRVHSHRCPGLKLQPWAVWPLQSWNQATLLFGPIDSPPMEGAIIFRCIGGQGDGRIEGYITIVFNLERVKIRVQTSREAPTFRWIDGVDRSHTPGEDLPSDHENPKTVSLDGGSDEYKIMVSAEQVDTPCDSFMLVKVVPQSRQFAVLPPVGESVLFSKE